MISKNKMNQKQTVDFINKISGTKLIEHTDKFSSYDAFDDNYIVEIKNRRANHKEPFLEVNKTVINTKKAKEENKDYLYIQADETGVYVFNISKINLHSIPKRFYNVPATTDFNNNERVNKEFWVLKKSYATIINL
jgi:hypothetical protein